jgi:drug/metabolite transporter (DMT)-like permease
LLVFLRELYHFSSAKTKGATSQSLSVQHFVLGVLSLFRFIFGNTLLSARYFDSTTLLATAYVGVFFSLVSYYLWNEAITLYTQKNGPDLLFNPFLVEYSYFFLNQAIIMTQIVSMGIIITGLLTNKKA